MKFKLPLFLAVTLAMCACNPLINNSSVPDNFTPGLTTATPAPAVLSYQNSIVSVSGSTVASGGSALVTVSLKDTNFNAYIGLPTVVLQANGGTSTGTFGAVTNHYDGSYSASFSGASFGTATTIKATVNGTDLQSTASLSVSPLNVISSGDGHETFTPNTAQQVNANGTQSFTVSASAGYSLSTTVGGTCPSGSFNSSTYTTGAITASCTVSFSATSLAQASLDTNAINVGSIVAYAFKEGSGTTLYDLSSTGSNGTSSGTWATDTNENKSVQKFNIPSSTGQSILVNTNGSEWSSLTKISAYFRVNIYNVIPNDYPHFFELRGSAASNTLYFRPAQGSPYASLFNCCNNFTALTSPTQISTYFNGWHDFLVTYDNSTGAAVMYTDGAYSQSSNLINGLLNGTVGNFYIFNGDSSNFQAVSSVVRFWNRTLDSTEAAALHANPMVGISSP